MRWNLRLAAAQRGIWKASELHRRLAEHGLVISAGKMSGLWSGQPVSVKLDDLDVIWVPSHQISPLRRCAAQSCPASQASSTCVRCTCTGGVGYPKAPNASPRWRC